MRTGTGESPAEAPASVVQPETRTPRVGASRLPAAARSVVLSGKPEAWLELSAGPTWNYEEAAFSTGARLVAGIDEVGRGPLAGPVAAAAVILNPRMRPSWLADVRDSKLLPPPAREWLAACIWEEAMAVGVGSASQREIDAIGIAPAGRLAWLRALAALPVRPDHLILDAFRLPESELPQTAVIHGDALSVSVAAASIVAKVARDRWMVHLDPKYPGYGFASHKGYAAPEHIEALERLGPCPLHRRTFSPWRFDPAVPQPPPRPAAAPGRKKRSPVRSDDASP